MSSIAKIFLAGCAVMVVLGALLVFTIGYYATRSPGPGVQEVPLEAAEQTLLDEVLKAADLKYEDLRQVGVGARLDMEVNNRAIAIKGGHVQLLMLRKVRISALPSLSAWKELQVLAVTDAGLTAFPDLSGCADLKVVDLARNRIERIESSAVPFKIESLDLSDNPINDLAPLAKLTTCSTLAARKTRVETFDALISVPIAMLDLRDSPIRTMPAKLPSSRDFRVDLEGCPVASPPGFLSKWNFSFGDSSGAGKRTSTGIVRRDSVEAAGTWEFVPRLVQISLTTDPHAKGYTLDPVEVEVTVQQGKLRVYMIASTDPRGPWFEQGYVKGTDTFLRNTAKIYVDATPGHPARIHGSLDYINGGSAYFFVEPIEGSTVSGMTYRVWRQ